MNRILPSKWSFRKGSISILMLFVAVLFGSPSWGQTNPTPQSLPFSFTAGSATLPAGMAMHRFGTSSATIPTTRTVAQANGDLPYGTTANSGSWSNENTNGFSMIASGSNAAGAFVVAINTIDQTDILVQWKAGTVLQQASRDNSLALQYRLGTTGDWINVGTTTTYTSQGKAVNTFSGLLSETLPADAENRAVVQVRWIYWESNGSTGSRDRIALDDVSISGTSMPSIVTPTVTTSSIQNLAITSATLGGDVTATGGAPITANGSVYALTINNANPTIDGTGVTNLPTGTPSAGTGSFTNATGNVLDANTQYTYRAYATNSAGTSYGSAVTFYTYAIVPGTPVVSNATASSLDVAIDVNANPDSTEFAIMENGGQYVQADGSLGATAVWQTAAAWGVETVTGLASETEYTFTVMARNGDLVETAPSLSASGTTLDNTSPVLVVGTLEGFGDVCAGADAVGSFTFSGENLTSDDIVIGSLDGFSYSLTENGTYTSTLNIASSPTMTDQMVWVMFSPTMMESYEGMINISGAGLVSSYNVAASGTGVNTAVGVTTGADTGVTSIQATLAGSFETGCSEVTAYGIAYSTVNGFETGTQVAGTSEVNGDFSVTVIGLEPNTVYYYKAFATDDTATIYGNQMSFLTEDIATPVAEEATDIDHDSFVANWIAVPGATSYRIDVSTSETFGVLAPATTTTETFEEIGGGSAGSYSTRTWTGVDGINWTAYKSRTDQSIDDTDAITLQNQTDAYILSDVISGGVSNISFTTQQMFTGSGGELTVTVLTGAAFDVATVIGSQPYSTSVSTFNSSDLTIEGDYKIRIDNNALARPAIDNLSFTSMPIEVPSYVIEDANAGTGTSFEVTGLDEDTTYYYRVRAISANSTSSNSNVIEVKTTLAPITFGGITVDGAVCDGEEATLTISGLIADSTSTIEYNIGGGDTQSVANVVADENGDATFSVELSFADNGQILTVTSIDRTDVEGDTVMVTENNTVTLEVNELLMFYADNDGDGFGNPDFMQMACEQPEGFVANSDDCDDTDTDVNPDATEILYNGIDDNCDGSIDEGNQLTTQIRANQCGSTLANIYSSIFADAHPEASAYRFEVTTVSNGQVQYIERTQPWFQLTSLANYEYGTAYSIAVEIERNGIWLGYYGPACTVSTPSLSPGALSVIQCGTTLANIYSSLNAPVTSGATQYRFRVTNLTDTEGPNAVQQIDRNVPWFHLTQLASYDYGKAYQVEVAVKTTGDFSDFGAPCVVTTPAAVPAVRQCGATYTDIYRPINVGIVPNVSGYRIRVTNMSTESVQIIDPAQSWINFSQIADYAPNTQYQFEVAVKTTGDFGPYGPACIITSAPAAIAGNGVVASADFKVVASPNPYSDSFALNITESTDAPVEIHVYDMIGKLLDVRTVQPGDIESQRIGNSFPSGVYNVIVTQGETVKTLKVIKR